MNIVIKKAITKEDAQIANGLLSKLIKYENKFNKNIKKDFIIKDFYEKRLDDKNCIAIAYSDDNEIAGYLYGYIQNYNVYINPIACIDAIYIEEKYRNNHIVTKLINYFIDWAKSNNNNNEIEINVLSDNIKAFEIYKHLGFKTTKYTMNLFI